MKDVLCMHILLALNNDKVDNIELISYVRSLKSYIFITIWILYKSIAFVTKLHFI
jgi:hypothetical protein